MKLRVALLAAVLTAAAAPGFVAAQPPAQPATWISDGGDDMSGAADLSDDGSQVAFQSYADFTAPPTTEPATPTTETPPPPSEPPPPPVPRRLAARTTDEANEVDEGKQWQVFVRDRNRTVTTQLSDPGNGYASAPSISGSGRLVAWVSRSGPQIDIRVADRDPDGDGIFDEPGERIVRRVTGTESDLRYERVAGCIPNSHNTPCGPQLSADGSSLVFPAWLSPTSPALQLLARTRLLEGFAPPPGDVIDFGPSLGHGDAERATARLLVRGERPVQLRGVTLEGGDGAFEIVESNCTRTVEPGSYCTVHLVFDPGGGSCPFDGALHVHRAQLVTDAATPEGRAAYPVIADCWGGYPAYDSYPAARQAPAPCPAPDLTGLRPRVIEDVPGRGLFYQVADPGPVQLGRAELVALEMGPVEGSRVAFSPPADCSAQLVTPPPQQRLPDRPEPCVTGSETLLDRCTAYVLLRPAGIRAEVASLDLAGTVTRFVGEGQRSVVIARRDLSGEGDFAGPDAPPPTVVSRDGEGNTVHGVEPSVSGDGRRVAFTSRVGGIARVYVHDTDARGDRSYRPGATDLVSILPPAAPPPSSPGVPPPPPPPPVVAGAPSLSDSGTRVAFGSGDEVYLRDIAAGTTVRVSDGVSLGHALSGDGSTVAFVTRRGDVDPGGLRVRFLPDLAGGGTTETPATEAVDAGQPAIDRHGRHVGFDTGFALVDADGNDTGDVYLTERLPNVTLDPGTVDFGPLPLDATSAPREVTVSNAGPGPLVITGTPLTGPFIAAGNRCAEAVHRGRSCTIGVAFAPTAQGPGAGTLTVSDLDTDYTAALIGSGTVGGTGPTVIDPDRDGLAGELVLDPPLAAPGDAVVARGTEFPPDTDVVLTWRPGLGRTAVTTDPDGAFTVSVLVFPEDQLGERVLVGAAGDVTVESEPFLVVPPSGQPPGFHDRG